MSAEILVVDDDAQVRGYVEAALTRALHRVTTAGSGAEGLERARAGEFDVVLLDLQLPDVGGMVVLQAIRRHSPDTAVVMLSGHGDIATAVEAMQLGAESFLTKPLETVQLEQVVERAVEKVRLRRRSRHWAEERASTHRLALLGESPAMQEVIEQIDRLAATEATVLLLGETGAGKGWVASLVHSLSLRPRGPFVEVNCAGLSSAGLDAGLFGEENGTRGGGSAVKRGLLDAADGGTLFLDTIGDLAPELQPKLLQVLETGRFRRVGGTREVAVDVRVIAATQRDLPELVRAGAFRPDLFYRVAAHPIILPPLRCRGGEAVADLAFRLLGELRTRRGQGPTRIATPALQLLAAHAWPGNIRELRNVLEGAVLRAGSDPEIGPAHLPAEIARPLRTQGPPAAASGNLSLRAAVAAAERAHISSVLAQVGGNRSRAARELEISRVSLYKRLKAYGLE